MEPEIRVVDGKLVCDYGSHCWAEGVIDGNIFKITYHEPEHIMIGSVEGNPNDIKECTIEHKLDCLPADRMKSARTIFKRDLGYVARISGDQFPPMDYFFM